MENEEQFTFDKFIDDILIKESRTNKKRDERDDESPQRKYNKLYRELPQNRIKYNGDR